MSSITNDQQDQQLQTYFDQIASLSFQGIKWDRDRILAIRDILSPWDHNIKLPYNVFTAAYEGYYPAHREMMSIINHALHGNFQGRRIIDIGCLDGYFAVECALQGATVVGVDGKLINVKKCEFIKSVLGIDNLQVVQSDAMYVTRDNYGTFDGILALGLLYHLNDPFTFIHNICGLCDGFLLLDTHIALLDQPETIKSDWRPELSDITTFEYKGKVYEGRFFREFQEGTSQIAKELSRSASLATNHTVWLTEPSLIRLLRDAGFSYIVKHVYPPDAAGLWWCDIRETARVLILAEKTRPVFQSKVFPMP